MNVIVLLDYLGVFVFAMSGLLTAMEKRLDLFGGLIIAFVTAMGGGTLRDLLLNVDVVWILEPIYIYIVLFGALIAILFKKTLGKIRRTIFLFDTVGIAFFTIIGVQKAILLDMSFVIIVIFGVITAAFGGVIRDILCNEIPLIFRKEIYATACLLGGGLYVLLDLISINPLINTVVSGALIIMIRTFSVVKKISLPLLNEPL
jgi:uncharacterized membrane protein YeiH